MKSDFEALSTDGDGLASLEAEIEDLCCLQVHLPNDLLKLGFCCDDPPVLPLRNETSHGFRGSCLNKLEATFNFEPASVWISLRSAIV